MKYIKPFNKVWLGCMNNLKLSLLLTIKKEAERFAYFNSYEYIANQEISGGNNNFYNLTICNYFLEMEQFSDISEISVPEKNELKDVIISQLEKERGYVILYVDLFNWLEGSVSWKKFHWQHYSLVADYDKSNDKYVVFDERQGKYVEFMVDFETLYSSIVRDIEKKGVIQLVDLKEKFSLPSLTITDIKENAKRTCDSIVNVLTKNFFLQMSDNDFRARSHMELNGIYLQRIEGRQRANQMFVDSFMQEHCFSDLKSEFAYLEKRWLDIRLNLYKSYFDEEERKDDLKLVNSEIKDALRKEMDLWSRIESSIK